VSQLSIDGDGTAAALVPPRPSLKKLREAAAECKACPLWEGGTQTVFGEGGAHADVVFVGEQPGDREDIEGHPFVGPAGKLLDKALEEVEIDRSQVYVTNVVKHFRYKGRGKRRIHQKPDRWHVSACLPWLQAELVTLTTHPSAILRAEDEERDAAMDQFVADLANVATWLNER